VRLWGATMVRNEADVIETFVRHNLRTLDGLAIVEHGSFDGTAEILAALAKEGLPLRIYSDREPSFQQSLRMTQVVRQTLRDQQADFVFGLDADEFLRVPRRDLLEAVLMDVPPGMHAVGHWYTYVPDSFDDGAPIGPQHLRRRLKIERREAQGYHKVIVSRALLDNPNDRVIDGNHMVASPDEAPGRRHARLREDVVIFAHCPVRSRAQLESKVILGYLARQARSGDAIPTSFHWRDLYAELRAGGRFTHDRLTEITCNYGLERKDWRPVSEIELMEDPVPLTAELRYPPPAGLDTLRRVMMFAETLVARPR
jgi:glycosyl transferase family 2